MVSSRPLRMDKMEVSPVEAEELLAVDGGVGGLSMVPLGIWRMDFFEVQFGAKDFKEEIEFTAKGN